MIRVISRIITAPSSGKREVSATWSGGTEGLPSRGAVVRGSSMICSLVRASSFGRGAAVSASIASSCRLAHALTSPSSSEDTRGRSVAVGWALGPQGEFERRVQAGQIVGGDCQQANALSALQRLRDRLLGGNPSGLTAEHVSEAEQHRHRRGVYLHGGVGRGKTMLMDMFYTNLPPKVARLARRVHFHDFMAEMHHRLHAKRGKEDPLSAVARDMCSVHPVLCFDEVELADVADALVFKRVFERVFDFGGVLVATSNSSPEELYLGGLNRSAFLPFINTLRNQCEVISLNASDGESNDVDYRRSDVVLRGSHSVSTKRSATEILPSATAGVTSTLISSGDGTAELDRLWHEVVAVDRSLRGVNSEEKVTGSARIPVASGRWVTVPKLSGRCARFSFDEICGLPLAASDYNALAHHINIFTIDRIPIFSEQNENEARRFINLVDILYERRALLVASFAARPEDIFHGEAESVGAEDTVRNRVKREGQRAGHQINVRDEGGSSGRSTTTVGAMEWSATGRAGASLAQLQSKNFTFRASRRCASRLVEMGSVTYERTFWASLPRVGVGGFPSTVGAKYARGPT